MAKKKSNIKWISASRVCCTPDYLLVQVDDEQVDDSATFVHRATRGFVVALPERDRTLSWGSHLAPTSKDIEERTTRLESQEIAILRKGVGVLFSEVGAEKIFEVNDRVWLVHRSNILAVLSAEST